MRARTDARSYRKSKVVNLCILYYLVVGLDVPYVHSTWDNNSGYRSGIPPPVGYCALYRERRDFYDRKVD